MHLLLSLYVLMGVVHGAYASSPGGVNVLLVKIVQNQLQTCMAQNAELIKGKCRLDSPVISGTHRKVAFHAGLSKNIENLPSNYKVVFDVIYLNEGKAYDPHTGVFTCPVDGVYVFHWNILTKAGSYFHVDFMVNKRVVGRVHLDPPSTGHRSSSGMVVQRLKKGDKVWIEPNGNNVGKFAHSAWSFLSGFRI